METKYDEEYGYCKFTYLSSVPFISVPLTMPSTHWFWLYASDISLHVAFQLCPFSVCNKRDCMENLC